MSIEDTLKDRITEMAADVRGGPSLQRAIQQGRTRRRRRAVAAVGSGVATVCALGVVAVGVFTGADPVADDDSATEQVAGAWTPAVPPGEMNGEINDAFYAHLPGRVDVSPVIGRAYDEDMKRLPEPIWEHAVNWVTTFNLPKGERVVVSVLRTDSGAASLEQCREDVRSGASLHCDVSTRSDGVEVVESDRRHDEGEHRRFERQVEVRTGGDYLVRVEDDVPASTYEEAESTWTLSLEAMSKIATDDDLLEQRAGS